MPSLTPTFATRHLQPLGHVAAGGRTVKRYLLTADGAAVSPAAQEAAARCLPGLLAGVDGTPAAAFSVLHVGLNGAWLNAYSWVWDNVLSCASASADNPSAPAFAPLGKPWVGCVWELAALEHERSAWVRHVLMPAEPDLAGYLADVKPASDVGL